MDLRCPKCNSTEIRRVSLVYEEGLFRSEGRTRLSAVVAGGGGPDLVVGRATSRGTHQSALSKRLATPVKWLYLNVIGWSVLAFLCVGWLVFYVNTVTTNTSTVLSPPLTLFAVLSAVFLAFLLVFVWRHNHSTYSRECAEWSRSFVCERCGTVSQRGLAD